jgi:hypothetical protein
MRAHLKNEAKTEIERYGRTRGDVTYRGIPARVEINEWMLFTSPIPESSVDVEMYNDVARKIVEFVNTHPSNDTLSPGV